MGFGEEIVRWIYHEMGILKKKKVLRRNEGLRLLFDWTKPLIGQSHWKQLTSEDLKSLAVFPKEVGIGLGGTLSGKDLFNRINGQVFTQRNHGILA